MSAKRLSLKSPPVIAGVLVMLAVVAVANVKTFGPKARKKSQPTARVQAHPALPPDLEDLIRQASSGKRDGLEPRQVARAAAGTPGRNPFFEPEPPAVTKPKPTVKKPRPKPVSKPGLPVCTAVLTGSGRPVALIGGQSCRPGDKVGPYLVVDMNLAEVTLSDEAGRMVRIPVGAPPAAPGRFSVTGGTKNSDGRNSDGRISEGRTTAPVGGSEDEERKEP